MRPYYLGWSCCCWVLILYWLWRHRRMSLLCVLNYNTINSNRRFSLKMLIVSQCPMVLMQCSPASLLIEMSWSTYVVGTCHRCDSLVLHRLFIDSYHVIILDWLLFACDIWHVKLVVLCCVALYCLVLYCVVLHCIVLYCEYLMKRRTPTCVLILIGAL